MKYILLALSLGALTCFAASETQKPRVCVFWETDAVFYARGDFDESDIKAIPGTVEGYLLPYLNEGGVPTVTSNSFASGDVKLTVKLKSVERIGRSRKPVISYTATLSEGGIRPWHISRRTQAETVSRVAEVISQDIGHPVKGRYKDHFKSK